MTLADSSRRIGRQPAYFSNMKRKQNGMFDHISSLHGQFMWIKYAEYTKEFDKLHIEIIDMKKALTHNRKGKEFMQCIGQHRFYLVNLCRYYDNSYSWKVFNKLKWTIEQYKRFIDG